ncbi:MAG: hypothetical protein JWL93_365, partial [Hyphomicrobiales bacterium]|nr:hypothetical protein [Hyphomicrobiales bacterium]
MAFGDPSPAGPGLAFRGEVGRDTAVRIATFRATEDVAASRPLSNGLRDDAFGVARRDDPVLADLDVFEMAAFPAGLFAVVFLGGDFDAARVRGDFLAAVVFFAEDFLATAFLTEAFLAGAFLAGAFLTEAFLAAVFLATAFLETAFLATAPRDEVLVAATFLVATFLDATF